MVDILGTSRRYQGFWGHPEALAAYATLLHRIARSSIEQVREMSAEKDDRINLQLSSFSDSFIITNENFPPMEMGPYLRSGNTLLQSHESAVCQTCVSLALTMWWKLFTEGLLSRGGCSYGQLVVAPNLVAGSAFLDCVKAEQEIKYPFIKICDQMKGRLEAGRDVDGFWEGREALKGLVYLRLEGDVIANPIGFLLADRHQGEREKVAPEIGRMIHVGLDGHLSEDQVKYAAKWAAVRDLYNWTIRAMDLNEQFLIPERLGEFPIQFQPI